MVELQDLINFFYTEELVYEDLQDTNIIFDSEWFFWINFDWSRKLGKAYYPVKFYELNPELV